MFPLFGVWSKEKRRYAARWLVERLSEVAPDVVARLSGHLDSKPSTPIPWVLDGLVDLHSSYEGLLILGGPGAGKTAAVGKQAFINLARMGCGFCVLAVKPDVYPQICEWAALAGRSDIVRFAPGCGTFDVLNYELSQPGSSTESVAQLNDVLIQVSDRNSAGGRGDEQFWALGAAKTSRRILGAVFFAEGKCSYFDMFLFLTSAPTSLAQVEDPKWQAKSFCYQCLAKGKEKHANNHDFSLCVNYWLNEWPALSDKTRSIFYAMVTNILDKMISGPMGDMTSAQTTTVSPDDVLNGKMVVLDYPVLVGREPAQFFQIIFKTLVQRAALRRVNPAIPVVLWMDEWQYFCTPDLDLMVATVARQAKLINVVLTQNLPMLYAAMGGGEKAKQQIDGILSCMMTKVLCANDDVSTNIYFSDLLGKSKHFFMGGGSGGAQYDLWEDMNGRGGTNSTANWHEHWHPDIPPEYFCRLAKPCPPRYVCEAYVFQGGRIYPNGKTWTKAEFKIR